jgi:cellulose synthase/poly-beta-1,6-N-acetylglucosamine synthase-like glycosyltransferase
VAIAIENYSALSLLELSHEYAIGTDNNIFLESLGNVFYKNHEWSHYVYLLISCFPVFVLYYTLLYSKLVPKAISIFGIIAVVLMFIQVLFSIFKISLSMDLLIPIALIQLFLPFWLIFKGLNIPAENTSEIVN